MPLRHAASAMCLLAVFVAILPAQGLADSAVPNDKSSSLEKIAQWINDLKSDRFLVREEATERLVRAGQPAIQPLTQAAAAGGLESASRMVHVLKELALSGDLATESEARAALEQLASAEESVAGRRASTTLGHLRQLRHQRALAEIERLGGKINQNQNVIVQGGMLLEAITSLRIDQDWKGGEAGLVHLKWLVDLQWLVLDGPQVTDQWIAHVKPLENLRVLEIKRAKISDASMTMLKDLPNLQQLSVWYSPVTDAAVRDLAAIPTSGRPKIYGTRMTRAGADQLQEKLAADNRATEVDFRRGAFLGVGCSPNPEGCEVAMIHPNSAAFRAGLQVGDVITKYNDKKVGSFEELTALIGENVAGDKIQLEILRLGSPSLNKEIELGEWD